MGTIMRRFFTPAQRRLQSSSGSERGSDADDQSEGEEEGEHRVDPPQPQGEVPLECHICNENLDKEKVYATCHGCVSNVHKECRETILVADAFHLKLCKTCGKWLIDQIEAVKQECIEQRKHWNAKRWMSKLFKTIKEGMVFSNSDSRTLNEIQGFLKRAIDSGMMVRIPMDPFAPMHDEPEELERIPEYVEIADEARERVRQAREAADLELRARQRSRRSPIDDTPPARRASIVTTPVADNF